MEKKSGGKYCCVPGCNNNNGNKNLSFHRFPENASLKRKWIRAINRRGDRPHTLFSPTTNHRVCSAHFSGGVKSPGAIPSNKITLADATPTRKTKSSLNAAKPLSPRKLSKRESRQNLMQSYYVQGLYMPEVVAYEEVGATNPHKPTYPKITEVITADHTYSTNSIPSVSPTKTLLRNTVSSTTSTMLQLMGSVSKAKAETKLLQSRVTDIKQIIQDKDMLNLYTGFRDASQFSSLVEFLKPDAETLIYPSQGVSKFRNRLSVENSLLVTLMKYKLDSPQEDLAYRFGVQQSDVSRIITAYTDLMYRRFRQVSIWPSQKLVRENMPDVFKEKYATTRVIIDCTEIFIQRPTSTNVQQLTWSSYKQHNTAKALIGVTPNLFISFLPDIQPGRLSDKEIVVRSGLVDMLEPGDLVMADRGFTIDDLLSQSVELNIPPFLCNKTQFNRQEVAVTRSIASVRIHVERVIGRIRRYNILNSTFPNNSLTSLNKIWVNCCYLTNLQHPKFMV